MFRTFRYATATSQAYGIPNPFLQPIPSGGRDCGQFPGEFDGAIVVVHIDHHPAGDEVLGSRERSVDYGRPALASDRMKVPSAETACLSMYARWPAVGRRSPALIACAHRLLPASIGPSAHC